MKQKWNMRHTMSVEFVDWVFILGEISKIDCSFLANYHSNSYRLHFGLSFCMRECQWFPKRAGRSSSSSSSGEPFNWSDWRSIIFGSRNSRTDKWNGSFSFLLFAELSSVSFWVLLLWNIHIVTKFGEHFGAFAVNLYTSLFRIHQRESASSNLIEFEPNMR